MSGYRLYITSSAEKDLNLLDKLIAGRITKKLEFFIAQDNPLHFAKKLNSAYGAYRFRIGDYRVIFDLSKDGIITVLLILRIKHRREVYE